MLLLTGATGSIGSRLLPLLLERGEDVRCLVREPRRLGERRVDVQIALGDLGEMSDPYLVRQALRGVDTVVHLAATIRDQPPHRIEELNGLATVRLLRAAERSGVERFVFFSALNAIGGPAHPLLPRQVAGRAGGRLLRARDDRLRALDRLRPLRSLDHPAAPLLLPAGAAGLGRGQARASSRSGRPTPRAAWSPRCDGADAARPLRAGRARDAHLRPDVGPGQPRRRPAAAARPPSAAAGPLRIACAALHLRGVRVCNLGGGRVDGGPDGQRARHRRRARPSESSRGG